MDYFKTKVLYQQLLALYPVHGYCFLYPPGLLAQSVERRANNANVMSSILIQATDFFNLFLH